MIYDYLSATVPLAFSILLSSIQRDRESSITTDQGLIFNPSKFLISKLIKSVLPLT